MARGRISKRPHLEIECWDCGDLIAACQCDESIHPDSLSAMVDGEAASLHREAVARGHAAQEAIARRHEFRDMQ